MHDFKALPHTIRLAGSNQNSSPSLHLDQKIRSTLDRMEQENAQGDPQIPHYFNRPVDIYVIALVGFLEAHGVKVWNGDSNRFPGCTCESPEGRTPIGLRLIEDAFATDQRLILFTLYSLLPSEVGLDSPAWGEDEVKDYVASWRVRLRTSPEELATWAREWRQYDDGQIFCELVPPVGNPLRSLFGVAIPSPEPDEYDYLGDDDSPEPDDEYDLRDDIEDDFAEEDIPF